MYVLYDNEGNLPQIIRGNTHVLNDCLCKIYIHVWSIVAVYLWYLTKSKTW
jgi:hypothetical protein